MCRLGINKTILDRELYKFNFCYHFCHQRLNDLTIAAPLQNYLLSKKLSHEGSDPDQFFQRVANWFQKIHFVCVCVCVEPVVGLYSA